MADLDFVTTEELIFELRNRADTLVLWYGKNGDDSFWIGMKGNPELIGTVGECACETADELSLLTQEELDETDPVEMFTERMKKRLE